MVQMSQRMKEWIERSVTGPHILLYAWERKKRWTVKIVRNVRFWESRNLSRMKWEFCTSFGIFPAFCHVTVYWRVCVYMVFLWNIYGKFINRMNSISTKLFLMRLLLLLQHFCCCYFSLSIINNDMKYNSNNDYDSDKDDNSTANDDENLHNWISFVVFFSLFFLLSFVYLFFSDEI